EAVGRWTVVRQGQTVRLATVDTVVGGSLVFYFLLRMVSIALTASARTENLGPVSPSVAAMRCNSATSSSVPICPRTRTAHRRVVISRWVVALTIVCLIV